MSNPVKAGLPVKPEEEKTQRRAATEALEDKLLAIAQSPQERAQAFLMASRARQIEMVREASAVIASMSWGRGLSVVARGAISRWCLEVGIDPARHVDILGDSVFVNGDYYRDVIAANPDFVHADHPQWLQEDPRLAKLEEDPHASAELKSWAHTEREQRRQLRIAHNVRDDCPAACIVTLHYRNGRGPFSGIGTVKAGKTASGKDRDPIGLDAPRETAETRAWREAGEKAEPIWFRRHPRLKAAEEVIAQGRELMEISAQDVTAGDAVVGDPSDGVAPVPMGDAGRPITTGEEQDAPDSQRELLP